MHYYFFIKLEKPGKSDVGRHCYNSHSQAIWGRRSLLASSYHNESGTVMSDYLVEQKLEASTPDETAALQESYQEEMKHCWSIVALCTRPYEQQVITLTVILAGIHLVDLRMWRWAQELFNLPTNATKDFLHASTWTEGAPLQKIHLGNMQVISAWRNCITVLEILTFEPNFTNLGNTLNLVCTAKAI